MLKFLILNMIYYRQIAALVTFFIVQSIFIITGAENSIFLILLKGVATGGLLIIFTSFAFPGYLNLSLFKFKTKKPPSNKYKDLSLDILSKKKYSNLIAQINSLVKSIDINFLLEIYFIDSQGKYVKQNENSTFFNKIIKKDNTIINSSVDKKEIILHNKNNTKDSDWIELIGDRSWRGSEAIMTLPVIFKEVAIGSILIYSEHFSSFSKKSQLVLEQAAKMTIDGIEDIQMNEENSSKQASFIKIANLFKEFDTKSSSRDIFYSIQGLIRVLFSYDKFTISLLNKDQLSADVLLVDGFKKDFDKGQRFNVVNNLYAISILKNKLVKSLDIENDFSGLLRPSSEEGEFMEFKSFISLPIRIQGKAIGSITVEKVQSQFFSKKDIDLLGYLCKEISSILNWKSEYEKISLRASMDGLTGLFNHRAFINRFDKELSRAQRFNQDLGLVFFDVDKFKKVNDTYGHIYGDYVLREIANIIQENVRTIDVVGRYGGEEFAVLLVNTDINACIPLSHRIVDSISKKTFLNAGIATNITISAGMAGFPEHSNEVKDLIGKADKAMYETKAQGGNNVNIYNE